MAKIHVKLTPNPIPNHHPGPIPRQFGRIFGMETAVKGYSLSADGDESLSVHTVVPHMLGCAPLFRCR